MEWIKIDFERARSERHESCNNHWRNKTEDFHHHCINLEEKRFVGDSVETCLLHHCEKRYPDDHGYAYAEQGRHVREYGHRGRTHYQKKGEMYLHTQGVYASASAVD